jgi:hypothetical protein
LRISGVERGAYELTIIGFLQAEPGIEQRLYRGSIVTTTCVADDCSENRFIRGLCDGQGAKPELTSAIFELGFLFLGGPSPPCLAACDADADGQISIGDPILVLNYLFLGGPPPRGWVDLDSDGTRDPTCEAATTEACAEAHAACE